MDLDSSIAAAKKIRELITRAKIPKRNAVVAVHAETQGIDTRNFWQNKQGATPTKEYITIKDIENLVWFPKKKEARQYALQYAMRLEKLGREKIRLRDSDGQFATVGELLHDLVETKFYGQNKYTETISLFQPLVQVENDKQENYFDLDRFLDFPGDILFAGDSLVVHCTVRDLAVAGFPRQRLVVLENLLFSPNKFHGEPGITVTSAEVY